jgi:Outer membrane efflux protein
MQATKSSLPTSCRRIVKVMLAASLLAAAGCAQLPRMDSPPAVKKIEQLGSSNSFAAPGAAWPGDGWWRAYRDAQLDALIEEALRGSPNLDLAQARLHAAMAQVQGAHATRIPEVTGTASFTEQKQSYNNLIPKQALPQGWNDYGLATVNLAWELDFWGKNRAALAAAVSEQRAAEVEVAQTRLILSTSVASAYAGLVHLYTLRDNAADTLAIRTKTGGSSASGTISVSRPWQVCVRSRRGRPERRATSSRSMSALACKGTRLRRSSVQVPIGASRSPVQPPSSRDPRGCRRT